MDIISQLEALGRNAASPWAIIKADNTKIYAYHLPSDTLSKLNTSKDAKGERIRFSNGCLKYHFGKQWENGAIALQRLADNGSDLFLIPNYIPLDPDGANGIGADFISHADSLFCEIDDISIPQQWQKIEEVKAHLGLEPSLVVFSGGKSLHIYFRLEQPLTDLSHWKRLQQKLICLFDSDPAIANPNREMRLAGVARKSKDSFQSIELQRDRAYGIQEIESILDGSGLFPYGMDDDRFRFYRREGRSALTKLPEEINPPRPQVQPREINPSDSDRFPLEICLTKHDQDLINGGAGSDRNNQGLKLAKNLIATADRLTQLGFNFEGDPYSLFIEYCQRCSSGGGWDAREWEQIWRSANLGNPSPSLPDDALLNRISYWNWEQNGFPRRDDSYQQFKETEESAIGGEEISKEEWLNEKSLDFWEWLKDLADHEFNGFDEVCKQERIKREVKKISKLRFGKDPLPTPEVSQGILPTIEFKPRDRVACAKALIAHGWGDILDNSFTGTGKSHELNQLLNDQGKTWYIHADHRNPTTSTAAKKTDLPSRHNGLVEDSTRQTATGEPYQRRWKWSPDTPAPDIAGNCFQADRFNQLKSKGYDVNSRNTATDDGKKDNFICGSCPKRGSCNQFGYKAERKEALSQGAIRSHIDSMPSPGGGEDGLSYAEDIAIWEETGTLLKATENRTLSQRDLDQQWNWLEEEAPEVYNRLLPIKQGINALLSGKIKAPHFGATSLPDASEEESLESLLKINPYDGLENDLIILWKIIDSHSGVADKGLADYQENKVDRNNGLTQKEKKRWKDAIALADRHLHGETSQQNDQVISELPTLGLYELLAILFNQERGVARVSHGEIKLTLPYDRHRAIAEDMGANIYADATLSPDQLAARLGIPREKIAVMAQEQPDLSNLTVKAIYMEGMRSRQYSPDCQRRQLGLVDHLKSDHIKGESALIAWKDTSYLDIDGYWFNDSRSTNTLKGVPNLIALGSPYQNYGAVKDEYFTIYGTLEGFEAYYDSLRQAEIIQLLGRQRCHLYPDQEFTIYLVATNIKLGFLEAMGINVDYSHALEWTEEAGSTSQKNKLRLIHLAIELGEGFRKLSQSAIAQKLGISQGYISKLIKQAGGKERLLRLFQLLYKRFIGLGITPDGLLAIKQIREFLNIGGEECQKIFADTVTALIEELRAFLEDGGNDLEAFETKTELPACLVAAIALGVDPPIW